MLKYAVIGGVVGEYGIAPIKHLNYNAVFTYAVEASQELHDVVKQQQRQIEELKKRLG